MTKKKPAARGSARPTRRKKPLRSVEIERFGTLTYHRAGEFWAGACALPMLAEKFGRYVEPGAAVRARLGWRGLPHGTFPVMVSDEQAAGPSAEQAAALRLLASKGAAICRAILRCHAGAQKAARRRWAHTDEPDAGGLPQALSAGVTVLDLHLGGVAYLEFSFLDDIDDEHGSHVVYHPKAGTHWTANAHETITRTDNVDEMPPQTSGDELAEALIAGKKKKARQLLDRGADINKLSKDSYPPLYYAVCNDEVDLVRQLLELGADPNKRGGESRSVLSEAKERLRDMKWLAKQGFAPPRAGGMLEGLLARREEIVQILQAAGAR
jgi:hypothetical protein